MIDTLLTALQDEFEGGVQFHSNIPATFTAPSVVVAPGDPFLSPGTHGHIEERWDILVVYNTTAPDRNIRQLRENSLKIRRAVGSVGALWQLTTGPRKASQEPSDVKALVINQVSFKYSPDEILNA